MDNEDMHMLNWLFWIGLGIGAIVLLWIFLLGPLYNQVFYQQYQTDPTHVNAVVMKIQDDCNMQLPGTTGSTRLAIERDIVDQAGSINLNQPNTDLTSDDRTCIDNAKQDIKDTQEYDELLKVYETREAKKH